MGRNKSDYQKLAADPRVRALLNTVRYAEGTDKATGYQTLFGGGLFDSFEKHPDTVVDGGRYKSAAAGAYQFMPDTYAGVSQSLGLEDFSPVNQDVAALALIDSRGALDPFLGGEKFGRVINMLAPEWASLPTEAGSSYYGQPVKTISDLYGYYQGQKGSLNQPTNLPLPTNPGTTIIQQLDTAPRESKEEKSQSLLGSFKDQLLKQMLPTLMMPPF